MVEPAGPDAHVALRGDPRLAVLVALLAIPTTRSALGEISTLLGGFQDFLIWSPSVADGWARYGGPVMGLVLSFLLMVLLWEIFVPVGRLLGRLLADHPRPIWAYSVNVAGSLVGIWLFVLASALYLPPAAWFAVFALGAAGFAGTGGKNRAVDFALLAAVVALGALANTGGGYAETRWTPYQKLAIRELGGPADADSALARRLRGDRMDLSGTSGRTFIAVNNTGYQATVDLRPETVAADPGRYGLRGMRERVAMYSGTLDAGAPSEGGWKVVATLVPSASAEVVTP